MRHRNRTDSNHKEISKIMRDLGWVVKDQHSAGGGIPDIRCRKHNREIEIEIKNPHGKNKVSLAQAEYIYHNDRAFIARCEADCLDITYCEFKAREKSVSECIKIIESYGKRTK